jgi:methyl-accepting chemotaxis protein
VPTFLFAFLYLQQWYASVAFADKEAAGVGYLAEVWPAYLAAANGKPAEIRGSVTREHLDERFGSAEAASAFARSRTAEKRLRTGQDLIAAVAEGSNLILDPELASYYAMDSVVTRLGSGRLCISLKIILPMPDGSAPPAPAY